MPTQILLTSNTNSKKPRMHSQISISTLRLSTNYVQTLLLSVQTLWPQRVSSQSKMLVVLLMLLHVPLFCNSVGYSYTRFVGPVSAPEEKVYVRNDENGNGNVDYIAHPKYQFAYGVEDGEQRVLHNRKETRDGDNVHGVYSVVDPDGSLRVVKYTADDIHGFQAEVITNGVPTVYGHTDLNNNAHASTGRWVASAAHEPNEDTDEDYATQTEAEDEGEEDVDYVGEEEIELGSSEEDFENADGMPHDGDDEEFPI